MFAAMFNSLHRRPRGRELADLFATISRGRVLSPRAVLDWTIEHHEAPLWPARLGLASRTLLEQLGDDGRAAVLEALPAGERELVASSPEVFGARKLLGYGANRDRTARTRPLDVPRRRLRRRLTGDSRPRARRT
jgi:hypothetical protein